MGRFRADTIDGFLVNMIAYLIDVHDPDTDGSSTGEGISLYQQLKDLVREGIPFTYSRARHIAERMVEIAPDHGETYDRADIEALADEINSWG